jgi:parallel beta-helix repeat protein
MAKFTSTVPLNLRLPGGFEASGAAGTVHRIPDSLIEEFIRDQVPLIPGGVTWITQDEASATANYGTDIAAKYDKTGGTISGAVTVTGALVAQSTLSAAGVATLGSVVAAAVTATTARFKGQPHYDIDAYGAVGDNSTDNATIINNLITTVSAAGGGEIRIPVGTYAVASAIKLRSNIKIIGSGARSILKASGDVSIIQAVASDAVSDVIVADIKVVGVGSSGSLSHAINLDTCSSLILRNLWVTEGSLSAIVLSSSSYCEVLDCQVTNWRGSSYSGISLISSVNNIVRGCRTSGGAWVSIGVENSSENLIDGNTLRGSHSGVNVYKASHRNRITNNDSLTSGSGIVIDGNTTQANWNLISGNHCHGNSVRGINLANADYTQIIGNYCHGNLQDAGIYIVTSVAALVQGNYCYGNVGRGINVTSACDKAQIIGNHCRANTLDGIRLDCTLAIVSGNMVFSNGNHGILTTAPTPFVAITGNIAQDNGTATTNTYTGITIDGARSAIVGNISINTSTSVGQARGIRVNSGTNSLVIGNVIYQNITSQYVDSGTGTIAANNQTT